MLLLIVFGNIIEYFFFWLDLGGICDCRGEEVRQVPLFGSIKRPESQEGSEIADHLGIILLLGCQVDILIVKLLCFNKKKIVN